MNATPTTFLCGIIIAILSISEDASAQDWSNLVSKNMPSIVVLHSYDASGEVYSSGTGFSVGKNKIMTCWHVIDDSKIVRVVATNKAGDKYNITHLLARSPENDIAVLKHDGEAIPAVTITSEEALQGSPAIAIGSPREYEFSVTAGTISSWRENKEEAIRKEVQFTAPVSPGNSGGPLFNKDGEVLGVISWIRVDKGSQNLNFAIAYTHVKDLIAEADKNEKPLFFLDRLKGIENQGQSGKKPSFIKDGHSPDYKELAERYIFQAELYRLTTLLFIAESQDRLSDMQRAVKDRDRRKRISHELRRLGRLKADLKRGDFKRPISAATAEVKDVGILRQPSEGTLYIFEIASEQKLIACTRQLTRQGNYDYIDPFIISGIDTKEMKRLTPLPLLGMYECLDVSRRISYSGRIRSIPYFHFLDTEKIDAAIADLSKDDRDEIEKRAGDTFAEDGKNSRERRPRPSDGPDEFRDF